MDRLDFIKKKKAYMAIIDNWKFKVRCLEDAYISSNQEFPIGSKVRIITPAHTENIWRQKKYMPETKRYAFVSGYEILCDEVRPILMKAKKDGSKSKIRDYYSSYEEVVLDLDKQNTTTRNGINFLGNIYTLNQCSDEDETLYEWMSRSKIGEYTVYYDKLVFKTKDGVIAAYKDNLNNYWSI